MTIQKSDPPFQPRRRQLAARRKSLTFHLDHRTQSGAVHHFHVTIGLYDLHSTDIGEIFINTAGKAGSESDTMVSDAAVAISLALQFGCPIEVLRAAMKRNPDGTPMGLMSHALDAACKAIGRDDASAPE